MAIPETFNWPIKAAADRAIQAIHGITALSINVGAKSEFFKKFTDDSFDRIEKVHDSKDWENEQYFASSKSEFTEIFKHCKFEWLRRGVDERIWQMFLERYNIRTMQLRASIPDILDCFNVDFLANIFDETSRYFFKVPLSTEIVICPLLRGIRMNMVIPHRLMILDMLLMLNHALECHRKLEKLNSEVQTDIHLEANAKLDAYARQVLILGTTICEAVLQNYGHLVLSHCKGMDIANDLERLHKRGLYTRLDNCVIEWPKALGYPSQNKSKAIMDMLAFTQFRNRLIHNDGRISCWHAFQLNINHPQWGFTDRALIYSECASYGIQNTIMGGEYSLAEFCANTVLETIDDIHRSVFPEDDNAVWVKIPRQSDGRIDLMAVEERDPYVRTSAA